MPNAMILLTDKHKDYFCDNVFQHSGLYKIKMEGQSDGVVLYLTIYNSDTL